MPVYAKRMNGKRKTNYSIEKGQIIMWNEETCASRPYAKKAKCLFCKRPFIADEKRGWKATKVMVREAENSWFRGEDTVDFAHPECIHLKKGQSLAKHKEVER